MRQPYKDRVRIKNAALVEGYGGQKVRDWESAQPSDPLPAQVYPVSGSREDEERRQLTITRWEVHLRLGSPVTDESRLLLSSGEEVEVDGEVGTAMFRGRPHHLELMCKLFEEGEETQSA